MKNLYLKKKMIGTTISDDHKIEIVGLFSMMENSNSTDDELFCKLVLYVEIGSSRYILFLHHP